MAGHKAKGIPTQVCRTCRITKSLPEFPVNSHGLTKTRCIACREERASLRDQYGLAKVVPFDRRDITHDTPERRAARARFRNRVALLDRQASDDIDGQAGIPDRVLWDAYMASPEWTSLRRRTIEAHDGKCERCGGIEDVQVHHTSYRRLGHELPEDLLVLCGVCHRREHGRPFRANYLPRETRQWGYRDGVELQPERIVSVEEYIAQKR
jgi:hypothetical protein